ncbi:MAG: helix-turn-helix domain-containing protein [Alphaproteobacteria bacterium]|nr:helix-turn-helix domain-containing protein [Alphaproteobacteria bacterium]
MRTGTTLTLDDADRRRLEAIVADRNTPQKHVWRCRIVLLSAHGVGTHGIMAATDTAKTTVWRWQERFAAEGVDGLLRDKTRPPGKAPIPAERAAEVVRLTLASPPHAATHWTAQAMARRMGLAVSTVQKIWKTQVSRAVPGPMPRGRRRSLRLRPRDRGSGPVSGVPGTGPWCRREPSRSELRRA